MKLAGKIIIAICVLAVVYLFAERQGAKSQRIGMVQMEKLVYQFKGMKEATERYTSKVAMWTQETDSIEFTLRKLYEMIRRDSVLSDKSKLHSDIASFTATKKWYNQKIEETRALAVEEDKKMTGAVIGQIQGFIKDFATENDYDLILCNSTQQNVGHAAPNADLTSEILEYANQRYKGVQ